MTDQIPSKIIGSLSKRFPEFYTHAEIDNLFLLAEAPEEIPEAPNKPAKVQRWLIDINEKTVTPLKTLGIILEDFFEKTVKPTFYKPEYDKELKQAQAIILQNLQDCGLIYQSGQIQKSNTRTASIRTLSEIVEKNGLPAIEQEINRTLENVEKDPYAACLFAANLLEATLKHYISRKGNTYNDNDGLSDLWKNASNIMNITPKNFDDSDLKRIASGLINVVTGLRNIRNKKSASHGKSEKERKQYTILPRHSKLAIHSAHTLAAYILELI